MSKIGTQRRIKRRKQCCATCWGNLSWTSSLAERDSINHRLQSILDAETDQWGIKVDSVEIKHVDLPQEMQRAMAKQAEAERERRSKIIAAEGEYQASTRLAEAADIMGKHPMTLQLRYLQSTHRDRGRKQFHGGLPVAPGPPQTLPRDAGTPR